MISSVARALRSLRATKGGDSNEESQPPISSSSRSVSFCVWVASFLPNFAPPGAFAFASAVLPVDAAAAVVLAPATAGLFPSGVGGGEAAGVELRENCGSLSLGTLGGLPTLRFLRIGDDSGEAEGVHADLFPLPEGVLAAAAAWLSATSSCLVDEPPTVGAGVPVGVGVGVGEGDFPVGVGDGDFAFGVGDGEDTAPLVRDFGPAPPDGDFVGDARGSEEAAAAAPGGRRRRASTMTWSRIECWTEGMGEFATSLRCRRITPQK
mmetsp:Transcript_5272/g.9650  ORF Transcript_5272/g.9650 Transcript_5272/m.9650 type:complete len:265 (+) Transcript_5272:5148-5942(+)